jgi:hypothetical protein
MVELPKRWLKPYCFWLLFGKWVYQSGPGRWLAEYRVFPQFLHISVGVVRHIGCDCISANSPHFTIHYQFIPLL